MTPWIPDTTSNTTRWALVEGGVVMNIVEQPTQPYIEGTWVNITGLYVGPGFTYDGKTFTPPIIIESKIITKIAMLTKRLTTQEFVSILTASKTDPAIEAWKYIFDSANTIDLDSKNTKDGMSLLVSKGLLTQKRMDEILTTPIQPEERP